MLPPANETPRPHAPDWNTAAQQLLASNPANAGLGHLIQAFAATNAQALVGISRSMDAVIAGGVRAPDPALQSAVHAHDAAIRAANAAASVAPFPLPGSYDMNSPIPNILAVQNLGKLLLTSARMWQASGNGDQAAQQALLAVRYSLLFGGDDQPLVTSLVAAGMISRSSQCLAAILRESKISPEAARQIHDGLKVADAAYKGVAPGVLAENRSLVRTVRNIKSLPNEPALQGAKALAANPAKFEQETEEFYAPVLAQLALPYHERTGFQALLAKTAPGGLPLPNILEAATRAEVARARIRIAQAIAASLCGEAAPVIDPFTGQPLKQAAGNFYSVGPDGKDDGGAASYDPKSGTNSAGDIIAGQ